MELFFKQISWGRERKLDGQTMCACAHSMCLHFFCQRISKSRQGLHNHVRGPSKKLVRCECTGWFPMVETEYFTVVLSSSLVRPFIARKAPPGFFLCFFSSFTCMKKLVFSKQDLLTSVVFFSIS
jgi:hypothetical protein